MSSVCLSVKVKSRCLEVWGVVSISVRVTIGVCGYMNVRIREAECVRGRVNVSV